MSTEAFRQAMQNRMLHNIATSTSIRRNLTQMHKLLRLEVNAIRRGLPKGVTPSPFQQRIQDAIGETEERMTALFEALDLSPDTNDPTVAAAIELVGALVGRVMALEARVVALENSVE